MKSLLITILLSMVGTDSFAATVNRAELKIKVKSYFFCDNGKSLSGKKYDHFCKIRKSSKSLYITFDPSEDVLFHPDFMSAQELGSILSWCNNEIKGSLNVAPGCVLSIINTRTRQETIIDIETYSNNIAIVKQLQYFESGSEYIARVIEFQSGSEATTSPFILKYP